jgi:hypothetical protein
MFVILIVNSSAPNGRSPYIKWTRRRLKIFTTRFHLPDNLIIAGNMKFTLSSTLLLATTALGQTVCPDSSIFRVHSVLKNCTNVANTTSLNGTSSFGYVKSLLMYSSRYHATLVPVDPSETPNEAWTLARAYTTDIYNRTDSYLRFPDADYVLSHSLGFTLPPLSKETPAVMVEINGADGPNEEVGTVGVYYDNAGKIQYKGPGGHKVHWHSKFPCFPICKMHD